MVLGLVSLGRESHFVARLLAAWSIGGIGTHRWLVSLSVGSEIAAVQKSLGCILFSFLSKIILFLCSTTTTLLWGE